MWTKNIDNGVWYKKVDALEKDKYDSLKQAIEATRLYSIYLSGSTYVPINSLTNIYDIINGDRENYNWYIGLSGSNYSVSDTPLSGKSIDSTTKDEYYDKYAYDYGLTLKNKFTPLKLINDVINNYLEVDVATTVELVGLGSYNPGLVIDGVLLKEGHRVLVKNQLTYVDLSNSVNPDNYFNTNYTVVVDNSTSKRYSFYNSDNGIYIYKNKTLIRAEELKDYNDSYRYSVSVKMGDTNTLTQYHLNRLKNGYYPLYINGDAMEFVTKTNWVLRNRVDYNNIFDINYYDIVKHHEQTYFDTISGNTYSIPERMISIGEFGIISVFQNNQLNIIDNKYKVNLRSIAETNMYYWICGDGGTLLRVSKLDFTIVKISINNDYVSLMSIDFYDDLRGIVVGKSNSIYFTEDGGYTWTDISQRDFDSLSFNAVIFNDFNKAYVAGDYGTFIEMEFIHNQWIFYKRNIIKYLDINEPTEEYLLVDDINDMKYAKFDTSTWDPTGLTLSSDKEVIVMVTNGNNVVLYNMNKFITDVDNKFDFIYLQVDNGSNDISSVATINSSSSIYIAADKVYSIDISSYNIISATSNSLSAISSMTMSYDIYANKLFNYDDMDLYLCGNNSSINYSTYGSTYSISVNLPSKYSSKLLFLDYEMGSKLNFFDDTQNYRLPNSVTFSVPEQGLLEIRGDANWLTYYKDAEKTYEYYTSIDDSNKVEFSTTFTYAPNTYFTFTASDINTSLIAMKFLAPNIDSDTESRYYAGSTPIQISSYSGDVFLHKYLIIFKRDANYTCDKGDVLYMECDILKTTFVVNKVWNYGFYRYIYCYIDFDMNVVNDILNYSGDISIINLNKFAALTSDGDHGVLTDISNELYNYDDMGNNVSDYIAYSTLAAGNGGGYLLNNFNLHPISIGYKLEQLGATNSFVMSTKYNNKTAYYNMATEVNTLTSVLHGVANFNSMSYTEPFLKFGYSPTYNILDYLSNVYSDMSSTASSVFLPNKVFHAMPLYSNLPVNTFLTATNSVYIDTSIDTNKIVFGSSFEFEWNSIWINTLIDVTLHSGNDSYTTERLLVMKKYYDSVNNLYIIEFHRKLIFSNILVDHIDIHSRNTLEQISDDLQMLNNMQRSYKTKSFTTGSITNLENDIYRINTDSYCKILLSDKDIKENLSAILYIDDKDETALNILRLEEEVTIPIESTSYHVDGQGYLEVTCTQPHNLNIGDFVIITIDGDAALNGYQVVSDVLGTYSFITDRRYGNRNSYTGTIKYIKRDPFLNYQPVDIMEVGVDKQVKRSVEILPDNITFESSKYNLVNVDFSRFRYELTDGISIYDIYTKYPWVLEGVISQAVIGEDSNGLVWYKGEWTNGRWFGGTWMSGNWVSGDWYDGIWNSYQVNYNLLSAKVSKSIDNPKYSKWYNGRWFAGTWNNGTWYNGRRYDGVWNSGEWYNGIWNNGTWNNGKFMGGIWVLGDWNGGIFNCNNKPSYWLDGKWYGGDFENGMWYNGQFLQKNGSISRFGTKAFNTRTAIWQAGNFSNGEFHSYLNKDIYGNTISSEFNKYSIWNTGVWSGGDWYGGVAYAINFNSGNWYGGVVDEIQILGLSFSNDSCKFILNGLFKFNIGDDIWIVNDSNPTPYASIGTNDIPGTYKVLFMEEVGEKTYLTINQDLTSLYGNLSVDNIETGLRLTAIFRNANWKQGVWVNGIFESGYFEGGIWYGGRFSTGASWGR